MGRRAISITLAVVCLAVLLGATGLFAISRETSYMQECASEGFAIDGYYRDDRTSLEILAFLEEDGCRWQLVNKDGGSVDGQFKGQLYLFRDSKVTRFYLVSTKPAFTVESGDVDPDS